MLLIIDFSRRMRKTPARVDLLCCRKDTALWISRQNRSCQVHVRRVRFALAIFGSMMRRIPSHTTKPGEHANGRPKSVRAVLFGLVAFVMVFQGLASLAAPWTRSASQEGVVAAVAIDCAREDSRPPASDGRPHKCSLAALCCLASCDGHPSFGLAGAAFSVAAWSGSESEGVEPFAPARRRLAIAGWASAWSSRAPPQAA